MDEGTIRRYKADLIDEVEPAINELIERAEQGLERMQKKESVLEAKVRICHFSLMNDGDRIDCACSWRPYRRVPRNQQSARM